MLYGNQLEIALYNAGLVDKKRKYKKPRYRKFTCRKCGDRMRHIENSNVMVCDSCGQWYSFSV